MPPGFGLASNLSRMVCDRHEPKQERGFVFAEILSWEVLVPIAIIALLFGSAKIPEFARSLGSAKREFEASASGKDDKPAATA